MENRYSSVKVFVFGFLLVLGGSSLMSCRSSTLNEEAAEQKVISIRKLISEGKFADVYDTASPRFKAGVDKNQFVKVIESNAREISDIQRWQILSKGMHYEWKLGSLVVIQYEAVTKEVDKLVFEEYAFVEESGELLLVNYRYSTNGPSK